MLAYVYGVVPISLCRGGGCGVSRGKGRGVRIDFDEDDGPITGRPQNIHHPLWKVAALHLYSSKMFHMWMCVSAVADAWRALKSPSLGESSLEGAVSGLSTTSPSEGLSAPGTLGDTPHFNTLAGGALGAHNGKYSRWDTGSVSSKTLVWQAGGINFSVNSQFSVIFQLIYVCSVSDLPSVLFSL